MKFRKCGGLEVWKYGGVKVSGDCEAGMLIEVVYLNDEKRIQEVHSDYMATSFFVSKC